MPLDRIPHSLRTALVALSVPSLAFVAYLVLRPTRTLVCCDQNYASDLFRAGAVINGCLFFYIAYFILNFVRSIFVGPFYPIVMWSFSMMLTIALERFIDTLAYSAHYFWIHALTVWLTTVPVLMIAYHLYRNRDAIYSIAKRVGEALIEDNFDAD